MTRQPGLPAYDVADRFPARVWEAVELSRSHGFPLACVPEVGRLLQLYAGLRGIDKACELGTAFGVGAAWIESGLRRGATLLTIELDAVVRPGGLVVLDDYTPNYSDSDDISRRIWLDNQNYRAQEILVSRNASVIVAVRTA